MAANTTRAAQAAVALVRSLGEAWPALPLEDLEVLEAHGRPLYEWSNGSAELNAFEIAVHADAIADWIATGPVAAIFAGAELVDALAD